MSATRDEIRARIRSDPQRIAALNQKIVTAARPLIPVLLDAGRANSAKDLQELFFELDAALQETATFYRENLDAVMEVITEGPKR